MADAGTTARTDVLNVIVELLAELDGNPQSSAREFYDSLCEALCRLVSMKRAGLMLYDDARQLVVPVGSHGVESGILKDLYGTLEETPVAQVAFAEDRVVEVSDEIGEWVPQRYARFAGVTTLTCTPVSAGGRWLGVIFADRGGGRFSLTDEERDTMWTLGKMAALAASVRIATSQHGRARLLQARIDLARELHERVVQRLFGVSLVLGSEQGLSEEARRRCAEEMQAALADLREALSRPLAPPSVDTGATLREEFVRLGRHYDDLPLELEWEEGVEVPDELEPLAQSVLAEALRNARKHASPSSVRVNVGRADGTFILEVRNDGRRAGGQGATPGGTGMGLRLAAVEALQRGGVVEFGPEDENEWRVRLVVPLGSEDA
ncbi:MAG TPA: GAF domain-containing protein [Thermoleophilaceae bacterium]|jgi:signal transduction histidine kinase